MSQENVERVIGRLATDEAFRRRFATEPAAALRDLTDDGMALTPCEVRALSTLEPWQIDRFAESLDPRIQKSDLCAGERCIARTGIAALTTAVLASATAVAAPAGPGEIPFTLAGALEHALEKSEDLIVSRLAVNSADEAISGARGAYDPALAVDAFWRRTTPPANSSFSGAPAGELAPTDESLEGGAALSKLFGTGGEMLVRTGAARTETNGEFAFLTPAYDTSLGFEVRQPLLRGLRVDPARLSVRVATADQRRATAELEREVSNTVAAVERAYWGLVAARAEVVVLEDTLGWAEEQLRETSVRIDAGVTPSTELAQPRAELERRRGDLSVARESVSRAQNLLKFLVLGDDDSDLWARDFAPIDDLEAEVEPIEVDVVEAMERALAARPELSAAAAVEEQRREEIRFARDATRPALDAVVSYDRFGLSGTVNPGGAPPPGSSTTVPERLAGDFGHSLSVLGDGDFDDTRVGLVFSFPLGNRSALAAARQAENAEQASVAETGRARKRVRAEVLEAVAGLERSQQRIEAAEAQHEAARVQLDAETERFGVGLSTNFLVLTRQNDLARARLDQIAARTDYRVARIELARSTGALLDERGIDFSTDVAAAR